MITTILKVFAPFFANVIALYLAGIFIAGFTISMEIRDIALAAFVLTLINLVVKPFLKMVLSPIIFLTLGLGLIAVNAFTIYAMAQVVPEIVSIENVFTSAGLLTLLYVTILTSVTNIVVRKLI